MCYHYGWEKMIISTDELKENIDHYLDFVEKETILIYENGRNIAVLSSVDKNRKTIVDSLRGIIPDEDKTMKDYRAERISERYSFQ